MHCFIRISLLESTNLSNVKIDRATINDKIDVLNLNKYTDSDRHSGTIDIYLMKYALMWMKMIV